MIAVQENIAQGERYIKLWWNLILMVEAAGVEPASGNLQQQRKYYNYKIKIRIYPTMILNHYR
jgi:hypothetical protein